MANHFLAHAYKLCMLSKKQLSQLSPLWLFPQNFATLPSQSPQYMLHKIQPFPVNNCAPYDIVIARNEILGVLEFEPEECIPLTENSISAIISDIQQKFPKVPKKQFTRTEIEQRANLQVPNE